MRSSKDLPHCCHSTANGSSTPLQGLISLFMTQKVINTSMAHFRWRVMSKVRCIILKQFIESNYRYYADTMAVWEDTHASSSDDAHHSALVGGDARDSEPTPPPTPMTPSGGPNIRCQHHVQGQPCGVLVEGGFPGILEHFACMHVRPRISANARSDLHVPSEFWTCCWGGKCGSRIRKEGFRRHVLGHLARWKCSTCSSTYSRDDSARKHAKDCGDGRIVMQPRLGVCPRRL